jgi:hypothetical protein
MKELRARHLVALSDEETAVTKADAATSALAAADAAQGHAEAALRQWRLGNTPECWHRRMVATTAQRRPAAFHGRERKLSAGRAVQRSV